MCAPWLLPFLQFLRPFTRSLSSFLPYGSTAIHAPYNFGKLRVPMKGPAVRPCHSSSDLNFHQSRTHFGRKAASRPQEGGPGNGPKELCLLLPRREHPLLCFSAALSYLLTSSDLPFHAWQPLGDQPTPPPPFLGILCRSYIFACPPSW